jgi:hypothetical protein
MGACYSMDYGGTDVMETPTRQRTTNAQCAVWRVQYTVLRITCNINIIFNSAKHQYLILHSRASFYNDNKGTELHGMVQRCVHY